MDLASPESLKAKGWLPVTEDSPEYDPKTQRLDAPTFEVTADTVVQTHPVINYTAEEIAGIEQAQKDVANAAINEKLAEIDLQSIRGLREWVVAQPGAPDSVVTCESEAVIERDKLK